MAELDCRLFLEKLVCPLFDGLFIYLFIITIRAAKQLQPHSDLPPVLSVPGQGKQPDVFGSEGVMEDIPLHLIIIPIPGQRLQGRLDRGCGEREAY